MKVTVNTYRLGMVDETDDDIGYANANQTIVMDQTARTIASWYHSPAKTCRNLTALSHGNTFDTEELELEIFREIDVPDHQEALLTWLAHVEAHYCED